VTDQKINGVWKDLAITEENKSKQVWLAYPSLNWTSTSYVQPQVHLWDRYLWDYERNEYTVDRYLADLKARYGGIDSVLLWPIYPNIGLDERNSFDMVHSLPGGIAKTRELVDQFHERGVKVLFGYTPWETLTRNHGLEPGFKDRRTNLQSLLTELGMDGFNADTMNYVDEDFFINPLDKDHPFAIEPE